MTKYQLVINAELPHPTTGYTETDKEEYYSAYVAHLLKKFESYKNQKDCSWLINCSVYKIENIRTMTLDEIGLHINNEKDYQFICSFSSYGSAPY